VTDQLVKVRSQPDQVWPNKVEHVSFRRWWLWLH